MVEEGERRAQEAEMLKQELIRARIAEKQSKEKLNQFIHQASHNNSYNVTTTNIPLMNTSTYSQMQNMPPPPSYPTNK